MIVAYESWTKSKISYKLFLGEARSFFEKFGQRFVLFSEKEEDEFDDKGGCDEDDEDVGDDEVEVHLLDLLEDDVQELEQKEDVGNHRKIHPQTLHYRLVPAHPLSPQVYLVYQVDPYVPNLVQLPTYRQKSQRPQVVDHRTERQCLENSHAQLKIVPLFHGQDEKDREGQFVKPIFGIEQYVIFECFLIEFFENCSFEFADIDAEKVEEAIAGGGVEYDDKEHEVDVDDEEVDDGIEEAEHHFQPDLAQLRARVYDNLRQFLEICLACRRQHYLEYHYRQPHAVQLHRALPPEEMVKERQVQILKVLHDQGVPCHDDAREERGPFDLACAEEGQENVENGGDEVDDKEDYGLADRVEGVEGIEPVICLDSQHDLVEASHALLQILLQNLSLLLRISHYLLLHIFTLLPYCVCHRVEN